MGTHSGIGYDSHRLAAGRPLIIGGVELAEAPAGADGHSDADVLAHAVIDALLGAAGRGDIGDRFPDSDPAYAGADSIELLRTVAGELAQDGFTVEHVDATVVLERPRLGPHKAAMAERLAGALGLDPAHVNVKATSGEGIGFIGRGEGVCALAIATVTAAAR